MPAPNDIALCKVLTVSLLICAAAYGVRWALRGRARNARTDAHGGSVFLGQSVMEAGYWVFDPVVSTLAALRITPSMVTKFSLLPGIGAGVAVGLGHFGVAAALGAVAAISDLLDGVLARRLRLASDGGELLDAAVDRYVEFAFIAGLVVYFRDDPALMLLALSTALGTFLVSYTTAKSEGMGLQPSRGTMRRAERAVYLLVGSNLTPLCASVLLDSPVRALREAPIVVAMLLISVATNLSALQRWRTMHAAALGPRGASR